MLVHRRCLKSQASWEPAGRSRHRSRAWTLSRLLPSSCSPASAPASRRGPGCRSPVEPPGPSPRKLQAASLPVPSLGAGNTAQRSGPIHIASCHCSCDQHRPVVRSLSLGVCTGAPGRAGPAAPWGPGGAEWDCGCWDIQGQRHGCSRGARSHQDVLLDTSLPPPTHTPMGVPGP